MLDHDEAYERAMEDADDRPRCPECGAPCVRDWDGDPGVIGGTRDFFTCPECGGEIVDEGSPLAVTEMLLRRMRGEA